jgi:hypothetical protein
MTNYTTQIDRYPLDGPNPKTLGRKIWDGQIALVSQVLDGMSLEDISKAYEAGDLLANCSRKGDGSYAKSAAVDEKLRVAREAFDRAIKATVGAGAAT